MEIYGNSLKLTEILRKSIENHTKSIQMHRVPGTVPTQFPLGSYPVPARFPRGPYPVPTRFLPGSTRFHRLQDGSPVPTCSLPRSYLVPTWFPPGAHLVPTRSPPGSHLVPIRFPPGSHPVPTQFPPSSHPVPTRFPPGTPQGRFPDGTMAVLSPVLARFLPGSEPGSCPVPARFLPGPGSGSSPVRVSVLWGNLIRHLVPGARRYPPGRHLVNPFFTTTRTLQLNRC